MSAFCADTLSAQTLITWSGAGSDTNWTTGANWVGGTAPVTGNVDALDFTGSTGLTNTNNNSGNFSIANITFDSAAGAFTINSSGSTLVLGASSLITDQSTALETLNANVNIGSGLIVNVTNSAGVLVISGNISGGHSLTLSGPGTLYLTGGSNLYTSSSGTNLNSGTLELGPTTVTSSTPLGVTSRPVNFNGGTLSLDGASGTPSLVNSVTVSGTSSSIIVGNATTALNYTLSNTTLGVAVGNATASGTLNLSMQLSSSILSINGPLTGGTGTTNLIELGSSAGTLRLNGSGTANKGGANITFDLGTSSAKMNTGASTGTVSLGALIGGSSTVVSGDTKPSTATPIILQIGNTALTATATFSGVIQDGTSPGNTTSVTKVGPALEIFNGASTYTGATNISGGTLQLNGSLTATSILNINSGGTLGGNGTDSSSGIVTLNNGGILIPGTGTGGGTLTLPNLTWVAGGNINILAADGTGNDKISLGSGILSKSGSGVFDLNLEGVTFDTPFVYTVISYASESGFSPGDITATNFSLGPNLTDSLDIGPTSLTFTISAVPEPAIYALALGGVALLAGLRRRRTAL